MATLQLSCDFMGLMANKDFVNRISTFHSILFRCTSLSIQQVQAWWKTACIAAIPVAILTMAYQNGITIGGGAEYLSSVSSGRFMPFANASVRIGSNLLFATEYTYGVRSKTILNYRLPSDLQFELDFYALCKRSEGD